MPEIINTVGFPFTSVGGDRATGSGAWREYFDKLMTGHVVPDTGNELQVKPQAVPNKSVYVDTGAVFIIGAMLIKTNTETLSIADNVSGNPRIDRIVTRINFADRKVELVVKQGTPAASPIAPALVQNTSTYYEVSLARIALANGFSTVSSGDITDERDDESVCGYSRFRVSTATASINGLMSATDKSKLDGIESGATADQTGPEIKALYEDQADTNAYTDSEKTKVTSSDSHRVSTSNPHSVSKSQVGLGSVQDYGVASQAEAEAGTVSNKYMTPERTKQSIAADKPNPVEHEHIGIASETGTLCSFDKADYNKIYVHNTSNYKSVFDIVTVGSDVHLIGVEGLRQDSSAYVVRTYTLSSTPQKIADDYYSTDPEMFASISGDTISITYAIGDEADTISAILY